VELPEPDDGPGEPALTPASRVPADPEVHVLARTALGGSATDHRPALGNGPVIGA